MLNVNVVSADFAAGYQAALDKLASEVFKKIGYFHRQAEAGWSGAFGRQLGLEAALDIITVQKIQGWKVAEEKDEE